MQGSIVMVYYQVRSLERDKVQEKKIKSTDVCVYLQQKLQVTML